MVYVTNKSDNTTSVIDGSMIQLTQVQHQVSPVSNTTILAKNNNPVFNNNTPPATVSIVQGSSSPTNPKFYDPSSANIPVGATVTWINKDSTIHTVTSSSGSPSMFDSKTLFPGQTFQNSFNKAGTYDYYCTIHPFMKGQIIVGVSAKSGNTVGTGTAGSPNNTFGLSIGSKTFPITYQITTNDNKLKSISIAKDNATLLVNIASQSNGRLIIQLPRSLIDSKQGSQDSPYIIFEDSQPWQRVQEVKNNAQARTLAIDFDKGTGVIAIPGSVILPANTYLKGSTSQITTGGEIVGSKVVHGLTAKSTTGANISKSSRTPTPIPHHHRIQQAALKYIKILPMGLHPCNILLIGP